MSDRAPSIDDLRTTIDAMERRLGARDGGLADTLMGHYWALVAQFEIDLAGERDRLLSRGGALMLIQAADHGEPSGA